MKERDRVGASLGQNAKPGALNVPGAAVHPELMRRIPASVGIASAYVVRAPLSA
jgi:hypothetical protein